MSNINVYLARDCSREEAEEVPEEGAMKVADAVPVVGQGDARVHHALRLVEKKGRMHMFTRLIIMDQTKSTSLLFCNPRDNGACNDTFKLNPC